MSNRVPKDKQALILNCLVEGMGVRPTARVVGCHHQTVLKLLCSAGTWASQYCDEHLRSLACRRLEVDEAWSFVYAKERNLERAKCAPQQAGDVWLWVAFDPETKLIPSWRIGDRTLATARDFMADLKERLTECVQLTSDGLRAYVEAVEEAFGCDVDYAMLSKIYEKDELALNVENVVGDPDLEKVSTSGVERQNLTMRMSMRRFTRKTNGFSKKLRNHAHAVALHFVHYNFCRIHQSIEITPAMAAGVTDHLYDMEWIVDCVAKLEPKPSRPNCYRPRQPRPTQAHQLV